MNEPKHNSLSKTIILTTTCNDSDDVMNEIQGRLSNIILSINVISAKSSFTFDNS